MTVSRSVFATVSLAVVLIVVAAACGSQKTETATPSTADRLVPRDLPSGFRIIAINDVPPADWIKALGWELKLRRKVQGVVTGELTLTGTAASTPTATEPTSPTIPPPATASTVPTVTKSVDGLNLTITTGEQTFAVVTNDVPGCAPLRVIGGGDATEDEAVAAMKAASCHGSPGEWAEIRTQSPPGYQQVTSSVPDLLAVHIIDLKLFEPVPAGATAVPEPVMVSFIVVRTDHPELLLARVGDLSGPRRTVGGRQVTVFDPALDSDPGFPWIPAHWGWVESPDIAVELEASNVDDASLARIVAGLAWVPEADATKLVADAG